VPRPSSRGPSIARNCGAGAGQHAGPVTATFRQLLGFLLLPLSQSHAGAPTVPIDELARTMLDLTGRSDRSNWIRLVIWFDLAITQSRHVVYSGLNLAQFNSKPKSGPTIYYDPSEEVLPAVIFPGCSSSPSADVWRSICFIALVWTRCFTARTILPSRRSSTFSSSSRNSLA
jgi:hypothetical protein